MSTYTVTRVRREVSADGSHRHIQGVCTTANVFLTRRQVVDSLNAGDAWFSSGGGRTARIKPIPYCPRLACTATPYITTEPDHTTQNNLESLPDC